MAAINREIYKRWVVEMLTALGTVTPKEAYAWIKTNCPVPADHLTTLVAKGEIRFEKEIRYARWDLHREGIVDGSTYGIWKLSGHLC
ncbi:hypothetical protein ACVDG9_00935 [Roseibium sp. RP-7]